MICILLYGIHLLANVSKIRVRGWFVCLIVCLVVLFGCLVGWFVGWLAGWLFRSVG